MITAIDTSVLIDVFRDDPVFGTRSTALLRQCLSEGRVVASDVVGAELAVMFPSQDELNIYMEKARVEFMGLTKDSAHAAGRYWKQYLERGGSRTRVIADFLVAAHAQIQCDRFLTRDKGFYRDYFKELQILSPE